MMVKQLEAEQEEKIPERPEKELADAFRLFDTKLDSKIDWDELKAALEIAGETVEVWRHILVTHFGDILFFRIGKLTNWCVMVTRTTIGLLIMMNLSIWWSVFQFLNKTISDWPSNQMSVWTWIPPVLDFGLIRLKPVRSDSKSRNIQLLIYYILFIQISWRHKSTQVRIWWRHLRWWRHQHTCVPNSIPFIFFEMKNLQIFSFWPSFK